MDTDTEMETNTKICHRMDNLKIYSNKSLDVYETWVMEDRTGSRVGTVHRIYAFEGYQDDKSSLLFIFVSYCLPLFVSHVFSPSFLSVILHSTCCIHDVTFFTHPPPPPGVVIFPLFPPTYPSCPSSDISFLVHLSSFLQQFFSACLYLKYIVIHILYTLYSYMLIFNIYRTHNYI